MEHLVFDVYVVCRGGLLPPTKSGVCRMNNVVVDRLENRPIVDHVSDLGALMAFEIAKSVSIPAYACYSAETVELESLVFGILKLLNGEEEAKDYT